MDKKLTSITPEGFLDIMRAISEDGDIEEPHINADAVMCGILEDLGYGEGVELFRKMDKYYA